LPVTDGYRLPQPCLDPVIEKLSQYNTEADLRHKIHQLYFFLLGDRSPTPEQTMNPKP
jgi:hypothetical protein